MHARPRLALTLLAALLGPAHAAATETRVFVFAGQSNMEGADSRADDIEHFPPFAGLEKPQKRVRFSYLTGREGQHASDGWESLAPISGMVGPELSFARKVSARVDAPIAIIKCAAGGTHLGGDWNPDEPSGFEMYPRLLAHVRASLDALRKKRVEFRLEGFVWHQGENDMFDDGYKANYGANLANFVARVRRDLEAPELRFYVGELCTKTIWGMDLRPSMYAISLGQKEVAAADPLVDYVPTSHVGVEIGDPVGLHYHYGTLGQLQHGEQYADAYLRNLGLADEPRAPLERWPYRARSAVRLFVFAGHRNMEGERAFVAELKGRARNLTKDDPSVAFRYSLGGGVRASDGWEPLGATGFSETFGPELSFVDAVREKVKTPIAVAKFTHGGSQIIDWTPAGSEAESRHLYPAFIEFVRTSIAQLEERGHEVDVDVLYHLGENDTSFHPYRKGAAARLGALIERSRADLGRPELRWFVSQQPPTDHESVNGVDVVADVAALAAADARTFHVKVFDLPEQRRRIVLDAKGVIRIGERLARAVLGRR